MNNMNNAVINNKNTKETINMKKSIIIAAAKKQQNQLDAARKAWKAAKTPAAKNLAQKAGENAKKNLEALRRQWRATNAVVPGKKETRVVTKEEALKAKYHELKVRGEQELFAAYKKELADFEAALKEKYAAKKKELHQKLLSLYNQELTEKKEEAVAATETVKAVTEVEEPVGDAIEADAIHKVEKQQKNCLFACDTIEEKIEPKMDIAPVVSNISEDDGNGILYDGDTFKFDGTEYRVTGSFDYEYFMIGDTKEKREEIESALASHEIEVIKKAAA